MTLTEASDLALFYLIMFGAVFHVGGVGKAWEKWFGPVVEAGGKVFERLFQEKK